MSEPPSSTTSWNVSPLSSGRSRRRARARRTSAGVSSYRELEPIQFAFNLLTRSGRISHASLTVRDPAFTRALDGWFTGSQASRCPAARVRPVRARGLTLRNRTVQYGRTPPAGAGLVLSGFVAVSPEGRITPETPTIDDDWEGRRPAS